MSNPFAYRRRKRDAALEAARAQGLAEAVALTHRAPMSEQYLKVVVNPLVGSENETLAAVVVPGGHRGPAAGTTKTSGYFVHNAASRWSTVESVKVLPRFPLRIVRARNGVHVRWEQPLVERWKTQFKEYRDNPAILWRKAKHNYRCWKKERDIVYTSALFL